MPAKCARRHSIVLVLYSSVKRFYLCSSTVVGMVVDSAFHLAVELCTFLYFQADGLQTGS